MKKLLTVSIAIIIVMNCKAQKNIGLFDNDTTIGINELSKNCIAKNNYQDLGVGNFFTLIGHPDTYDTVKCVILVTDSTTLAVSTYANSVINIKGGFKVNDTYIIIGYAKRKAVWIQSNSDFYEPVYFIEEYYNEYKQKLPSNIIVWLSKTND